jgi:hypothetical protein
MRPASHWRGFWAGIVVILASLRGKISGAPWRTEISRQRQQYWWRGYQRQRGVAGVPASLSQLLQQRVIVATHSLRFRRQQDLPYDPHRIFAVTTARPMS